MYTRTAYRTNGTYEMQGAVGTTDHSFTNPIGDAGTWRVEGGYLYTTVTNQAPGRINGESRDQVLSLSVGRFTYRTERGQVRTAERER